MSAITVTPMGWARVPGFCIAPSPGEVSLAVGFCLWYLQLRHPWSQTTWSLPVLAPLLPLSKPGKSLVRLSNSQPSRPGHLRSSSFREHLRTHRVPSHFHFKGLPFFLPLLQDAKGNILNGFIFYKIPDQDQKCLADNFVFWPWDKKSPSWQEATKRPDHLLTVKERKKHRVGQTQVNIPKTKPPHTVDSLVSFQNFLVLMKQNIYLHIRFFFFFKQKGDQTIHMQPQLPFFI